MRWSGVRAVMFALWPLLAVVALVFLAVGFLVCWPLVFTKLVEFDL